MTNRGEPRYGSATAQDLYDIFIGSDALDRYPWWELQDDEDDRPVPDDWYVIVDVGDDISGTERRRLDAARLWMAILACATGKIASVDAIAAVKCRLVTEGTSLDRIKIDPPTADTVMQVAVYGQVQFGQLGVQHGT